jgi:hypothetical protein
MRKSRLAPATPGDLREVHHQLLAVSYLLENKSSEVSFRFDMKEVYFGLGRILEVLATEIDVMSAMDCLFALLGNVTLDGELYIEVLKVLKD